MVQNILSMFEYLFNAHGFIAVMIIIGIVFLIPRVQQTFYYSYLQSYKWLLPLLNGWFVFIVVGCIVSTLHQFPNESTISTNDIDSKLHIDFYMSIVYLCNKIWIAFMRASEEDKANSSTNHS